MAGNIRGITIEIDGKTTKLQKALGEVNQKSRELNKELRDVEKSLKFNPGNTELLIQKQRTLKESIGNTKDKLNELKNAQKQAADQLKNGKIGQDEFDALRREVIKTENQLKTFEGKLKEIKNIKLEQLGNQFKNVGSKMTSAGKTMTTNVTAPIGLAGGAAVKMAADFEDGFAKVSTLLNEANDPVDKIKENILDLSSETGAAATEINDAVYQAISAGVDASESTEFVYTAIKAAKGGFTDAETAVDGLTTVLNAYGMESENAEKIANQMLITQNQGKTTFGELASSLGKVVPTASAAGISTEELMSSLAATTAQGLGTSESVTALKGAMSNIIKPSKKAQEAADLLGLSFDASSLQSDGWTGTLQKIRESMEASSPAYLELVEEQERIVKGMKECEETGQTNTDFYEHLTGALERNKNEQEQLVSMQESGVGAYAQLFGSVEALNAVLMLTSDEGMAKYNATMDEMATNQTALQDAYDKMDEAPGAKMQKALNDLNVVGVEIGQTLLPVVLNIAEKIRDLAQGFASLSPGTQDAIVKFALVAAAVGPLLVVLGTLISSVGSIIGLFAAEGALAGALTAVSGFFAAGGTAATIFGSALAFITGPIGIAIGIITALVAAGVLLYKNWDTVKEYAAKLGEFLSETWENIKTAVGDAFNAIGRSISDTWQGIKEGANEAWDGITSRISEKWESIKTAAKEKFDSVKDNIGTAWDDTKKATTEKWKNIKTSLSEKWQGIKDAATEKFNAVKDNIGTTWDNVSAKTGEAWGIIKGKVDEHGGGINGILGAYGEAYQTVMSSAWDAINQATGGKLGEMAGAVNTKFDEIKGFIQTPIENATNFIREQLDKIVGFFGGLSLEFPNIKMPHFSIDGEFSLAPPSVPTLGIDWYAKGGIFTRPTIFAGGIGVGEAGAEAVLPIDRLSDIFANTMRQMDMGPTLVVQNLTVGSVKDADMMMREMDRLLRQKNRSAGR